MRRKHSHPKNRKHPALKRHMTDQAKAEREDAMHDLIPVFPDRKHLYVREIMENAQTCPVCSARNGKLVSVTEPKLKPRYAIVCTACNNIGPFGKTLNHALKNWNNSVPKKPFAFIRKWLGAEA
jgi:hypothetical protein